MTLGYEEGNGDRLLPCPGANGGPPFTEAQLIAANQTGAEGQALLEDYCAECYQSVCTRARADKPRSCGGDREGGVEVGQGNGDDNVVQMVRQVGPAYHCHLTMADGGACDFVQYDQHEYSREYNMSSAVYCGWERVTELQITHCDCTREAGTNNGCGREEGLKMALAGVACGNCNSVNQDTAYEQIFGVSGVRGAGEYDGVCALATDTRYSDAERAHYKMMCSRGLFCRNGNMNSDGCKFHCENYQSMDARCPGSEAAGQCNPVGWTGYDGKVCGVCSALVNVRDNGGSCNAFCAKQGLACADAWDDTIGEQCSLDAPKLGCAFEFERTSDGICQCAPSADVDAGSLTAIGANDTASLGATDAQPAKLSGRKLMGM